MLENQIKKIREVIENSKNPVMFFDCDTDGATSYLQLKNVFSKIKGFPMLKDFKKQKELVANNLNQEVDLLIIFDIPYLLDDFLKLVRITNPNCKIAWVDHHPTNSKELIDKYNILHLNPLNYDKNDNRAASYLSYLISGKIEKNLEFAVLGSVADFYLLDIIKELEYSNKRTFKILFPNLDNSKKEELFDFIDKYKFNDKRVMKQREYWIRYLTYGAGLIKLKNFFDFLFKFKEDGDTLRAFKYIEKLSLFNLNIEINANKEFLFENYSNLMKKYSPILDKAINNRV